METDDQQLNQTMGVPIKLAVALGLITCVILAYAIFGDFRMNDNTANGNAPTPTQIYHPDANMIMEERYTVEVTEAPTITVNAIEDSSAVGSYIIQIETTNFVFAPLAVNGEHQMNHGHAHIYVDGKKVNRVYGEWYQLSGLTPGTHTIKVTLSTNDHQLYAVDGVDVADSVEVIVMDNNETETPSMEMKH